MKEMEIRHEPPPMLEAINKAGMFPDLDTTVFTYGYILYNPGKNRIPMHLMEHESTHAKQQTEFNGGPDAWWLRYLSDVDFRINQEVEAYRAQYKTYCKLNTQFMRRATFLASIAEDLSGPIYNAHISFEQARAMIV